MRVVGDKGHRPFLLWGLLLTLIHFLALESYSIAIEEIIYMKGMNARIMNYASN